jgi:hypothetical protein
VRAAEEDATVTVVVGIEAVMVDEVAAAAATATTGMMIVVAVVEGTGTMTVVATTTTGTAEDVTATTGTMIVAVGTGPALVALDTAVVGPALALAAPLVIVTGPVVPPQEEEGTSMTIVAGITTTPVVVGTVEIAIRIVVDMTKLSTVSGVALSMDRNLKKKYMGNYFWRISLTLHLSLTWHF